MRRCYTRGGIIYTDLDQGMVNFGATAAGIDKAVLLNLCETLQRDLLATMIVTESR